MVTFATVATFAISASSSLVSSSMSLPSSTVSGVMSGAESDLKSEIRSSYPSRTSEKSECEAVGLWPGMFCDPAGVALRVARLLSEGLPREDSSQQRVPWGGGIRLCETENGRGDSLASRRRGTGCGREFVQRRTVDGIGPGEPLVWFWELQRRGEWRSGGGESECQSGSRRRERLALDGRPGRGGDGSGRGSSRAGGGRAVVDRLGARMRGRVPGRGFGQTSKRVVRC